MFGAGVKAVWTASAVTVLVLTIPVRGRLQDNFTTMRIGVTQQGGRYAVAALPLEAYVARVLTAEALPDSQPAALEALAITIRTYALANLGRHQADGFDLCDETHCQVMRTATPATERAAAATAGRVLLDGGQPASVYYSASCGGRTEVPSAVWPGAADPPFLPSQEDDACRGAPAWTAQVAERDLFRALRAGGFRGDRLRDVRVVSRTSSGRVARLRVDGLEPEEISGQDLRAVVGRTLGWQHIKSAAFDLKREADGYRFNGHGSGHGVGMCVIGSARLAESGRSATDILHRYFPGLTIAVPDGAFVAAGARMTTPAARRAPASSAVPDVIIALPDGDEGERRFIGDLVARARRELAHTLGVSAPSVTLRFHPTVESYERLTAEPWFTTGAVIDGDIHLLPPAVLRRRGVLEQTLRHELVHVLTSEALADRAVWVREGAAMYFAGEPVGQGDTAEPRTAFQPRPACPDDSDLLRPVSAGMLTNAYTRARLCFARQIAQGKSWRDIR